MTSSLWSRALSAALLPYMQRWAGVGFGSEEESVAKQCRERGSREGEREGERGRERERESA
jgi:hypothetical protein